MNNLSRYIAIAATLAIIGFIFYTFSSIVGYVLIAWVVSMIGQPLMHFLQKPIKLGKFEFNIGPVFSAIITLICFFIVISALILMFVPLIIEQANNLAGVDFAAIGKALEEPINELQAWLESYGIPMQSDNPEELIRTNVTENFEPNKIGNFFGNFIAAAGNIVITVFSVVFIAFFFLKEQGLFTSFIQAILPNKYEQQVAKAIEEVSTLLTRYFGGILVQMSVITIFVFVLLYILGIKNALLIGFFAALINVIPYVGPIIGAIFGVFITISSNLDLEFYTQMLPLILKVLAVFASMQMLDNFILQPYIFSNSVLAHPLEIFIVILMGSQINGVVGMVLAIPAYTVIRVIARVFLSEFKIVQSMTRNLDEAVDDD